MFDREGFSVAAGLARLGLGHWLVALTCALVLIVAAIGKADAEPAPAAAFTGTDTNLSPQRLHALVGRIALYPDDLLALVLTAATQPLQIVEAKRFLDARQSDPTAMPPKTWDPSVIALLNYPDVVKLMDADLPWTQQLGTSIIEQRAAVLDAIQDFRGEAYRAGTLRSNDKETVTVSSDGGAPDQGPDQSHDETISIAPAAPQVIYVPSYDPSAVVAPAPVDDGSACDWSPAYPYYGDATALYFPDFWDDGIIGFAFDWHDHQIFRGDGHRHHDRGHGANREGAGRLRPPTGVTIGGRSIWEPDHSAVRQSRAGFSGRDPAGARLAMSSAAFGHPLPAATVARPLLQVVRGSAGIGGPSSVQVLRGTPPLRNGAVMARRRFVGSPVAAPRFSSATFPAPLLGRTPVVAPRPGLTASPVAGGGARVIGAIPGGFEGSGGFHGGGFR